MRRAVANVEEHPKSSGRYRVRARVEGKLRTLSSGLPESEAFEVARAYQTVKHDAELREGLTLTQFGKGFLERRERRRRGAKKDASRWRTYIDGDPIGGHVLATLIRRDVLEWLDRRGELAVQTQRNALNLLRVALQEAVDRDLMPANPARDIRVEGEVKETDDLEGVLTPAEQRSLLEHAPSDDHRDAAEFALFGGVRQSSQWWLRREDCHGETAFFRRQKNGKPRTKHLLGPARDALSRSLARHPSSPWAFPAARGGRRYAGRKPTGWHAWVKASGIARRIRWHDLRHTCATSLLAGWWGRKWTLDEVCGYLDHSSVKVTERYARKLGETQAKAVAETPFPNGNGRESNHATSHIGDAHCKTVIRGFESRPHLRQKDAVSLVETAERGEQTGNFSAAAWSLALTAERLMPGVTARRWS